MDKQLAESAERIADQLNVMYLQMLVDLFDHERGVEVFTQAAKHRIKVCHGEAV